MNHRMKILSVSFAVIFLFLTSCTERENEKEGEGEPILDYPVLTLSLRSATLQNVYPATLEGQQNIEIRPKIDGFVEEIYIDEGATVQKGDRLFKIDAPQYEQ